MADKKTDPNNQDPLRTITDEEIVTERTVPRRSFLSSSGALLAGVVGVVSGACAAGQQDDPDKKPEDTKKPEDRRKTEDRKPEDRRKTEHRKADDPDKRPEDTRKPDDSHKPDDPHR